MINYTEYFKHLLACNLSPSEIDIAVSGVYSPESIGNNPFMSITTKCIDDVIYMSKGAYKTILYTTSNKVYFSAYYNYTEKFPIGRSYTFSSHLHKIKTILQILKIANVNYSPVTDITMPTILSFTGFQERIKKSLKKALNLSVTVLESLLKGEQNQQMLLMVFC